VEDRGPHPGVALRRCGTQQHDRGQRDRPHPHERGSVAFEVVAELLAAMGVAQLRERLALDLADPLAGDAELLADLFERVGRALAVEAAEYTT